LSPKALSDLDLAREFIHQRDLQPGARVSAAEVSAWAQSRAVAIHDRLDLYRRTGLASPRVTADLAALDFWRIISGPRAQGVTDAARAELAIYPGTPGGQPGQQQGYTAENLAAMSMSDYAGARADFGWADRRVIERL